MNEDSMFEGGEVTSLREHSWLLFEITYPFHGSGVADSPVPFLYAIR